MKLSSVIRVISAHSKGSEADFGAAVSSLADEEERKGNHSGAKAIRDAYQGASMSAFGGALGTSSTEASAYGPSSAALASPPPATHKLPPKDKDSALDLFEWISPRVPLESLVLPPPHRRAITDFIEEQRQANRFAQMGLQPSQRLLLCGPPGCGKTMTAFAIATELGLPVAYVRLDGLVSSFLGQTGTNIRRVFESVRGQRVILLLDEIDAIAKKRDDQHELGELKRVVTTLLQNFDNLGPNVVIIAATNHPHLLDPALWRRFNVVVTYGQPDEATRKVLLERLLSKFHSQGLRIPLLVKATEGLSPANIEEIVHQAAKRALAHDSELEIHQADFYDSLVRFFAAAVMASGDPPEDLLLQVACDLHSKGVPLRDLADGVGIPKSTLQERFNRLKGGLLK